MMSQGQTTNKEKSVESKSHDIAVQSL